MVRILRYERTSIAQIALLHADYGPMALCISPAPDNANPIAREQRHGMQLAWWKREGYPVCADWPQPTGSTGCHSGNIAGSTRLIRRTLKRSPL